MRILQYARSSRMLKKFSNNSPADWRMISYLAASQRQCGSESWHED